MTAYKYAFLIALLTLAACAYRPKIISVCPSPEKQHVLKKEEPGRLRLLEKLQYRAAVSGIPSGKLVLEVKGIEQVNNRACYHITAIAGPNSFFSLFYKVKYFVETYIDKDTGLPLKFYKKKTFRNRTTEESITFDYANNTATWEFTAKPKVILKLNRPSHNLLSFLYYFRKHGLEADKTYDFDVVYGGKIWPVKMETKGNYLLKLRNGACVKAIYVKLASALIGKIIQSGEIEAYVSADANFIPIFFTAKTKMGDTSSSLLNFDCLK